MMEYVAATLNDLDGSLPVSRSRCFDIGTWGGCGVSCPAFLDGECTEPQEIDTKELISEYGIADSIDILRQYKDKE